MTEIQNRQAIPSRFCHLDFGHSILFRISIFDIRIYTTVIYLASYLAISTFLRKNRYLYDLAHSFFIEIELFYGYNFA